MFSSHLSSLSKLVRMSKFVAWNIFAHMVFVRSHAAGHCMTRAALRGANLLSCCCLHITLVTKGKSRFAAAQIFGISRKFQLLLMFQQWADPKLTNREVEATRSQVTGNLQIPTLKNIPITSLMHILNHKTKSAVALFPKKGRQIDTWCPLAWRKSVNCHWTIEFSDTRIKR